MMPPPDLRIGDVVKIDDDYEAVVVAVLLPGSWAAHELGCPATGGVLLENSLLATVIAPWDGGHDLIVVQRPGTLGSGLGAPPGPASHPVETFP